MVIVGGGFGGLKLAEKLHRSGFQVVLIDKNNYHQFSPLIYQVASSGLEPSSIAFPFRKLVNRYKDIYFRMAEARVLFPEKNILQTSIGKIEYDYLVLAAGATSNFYGNKNVEDEAIPMKTLSEAMGLRNALLSNFERSVTCATEQERDEQFVLPDGTRRKGDDGKTKRQGHHGREDRARQRQPDHAAAKAEPFEEDLKSIRELLHEIGNYLPKLRLFEDIYPHPKVTAAPIDRHAERKRKTRDDRRKDQPQERVEKL